MYHQNQGKDRVDIKNQCPKVKKEVSKKTADKVSLSKQAIEDMYAYYGEPSASMFNKVFKDGQ